jgi:regulator of protease activity HflC (stomatin/prohibitin superfamily)
MKRVQDILSRPSVPLLLAPVLWIIGLLFNLDWWWFGGIVWAVVTGFVMYIFGLWLAGAHILPIMPDRESLAHARALLRHFVSGQKTLMAVVREGKLVPGPDGKPRTGEGFGAVLIDSTSAVALVTNTGLSRVTGPGLHFTRRGEKIGPVVDLRPQARSKEIETQTRDGIWVKFKVIVRFQIDGVVARKVQDIDQKQERWPEPYVWSPRQVARALGLERVGVEQRVRWDEIALNEAIKRSHTYISEYTFDELTEPRNPLVNRRDEIRQKLDAEVKAALARSGIKVIDVKLGQFQPRDEEVVKQRLDSWQSELNRRKKVVEAEGEAESRRQLELARTQAQMDTMTRMIEALDASWRAGANNADLIALRFLEVLEGLAKDPETQKTLGQVRSKLLRGGGTSSGAHPSP